MTDREKAEYVAEKLLGWKRPTPNSRGYWLTLLVERRILEPADYLTTWQGAGEIIEAMREQPEPVLKWFNSTLDGIAWWDESNNEWTGFHLLTPQAILNAAYAALQEK